MTGALRAAGPAEPFTADERARLAPYFTDLDGHVFALTNLPETVKGALFARYSRSGKSLRRLFLDEFADKVGPDSETPQGPSSGGAGSTCRAPLRPGIQHYGDDSVAQWRCAHRMRVRVERPDQGARVGTADFVPRQSTRYLPYTDRRHDRWRYTSGEIGAARSRSLCAHDGRGVRVLRGMDPAPAGLLRGAPPAWSGRLGIGAARPFAPRRSIRAWPAPAGTQSNVGSTAAGSVRVAAAADARPPAARGPRVRRRHAPRAAEGDSGVPDPGRSTRPWRRWSEYLASTRERSARWPRSCWPRAGEPRDEVTCLTSIRTARIKVVASALYAASRCPTIS